MEKIKEVLKEHDIAGSIVLHTPGHGEYALVIDPSYSCAFYDPTPGVLGIRVRTRLQEDYKGNVAKRNQAQEDTVNMFDSLSEGVGKQAIMCMETMKMLEKHFDITRTRGGSSSHETQNN